MEILKWKWTRAWKKLTPAVVHEEFSASVQASSFLLRAQKHGRPAPAAEHGTQPAAVEGPRGGAEAAVIGQVQSGHEGDAVALIYGWQGARSQDAEGPHEGLLGDRFRGKHLWVHAHG